MINLRRVTMAGLALSVVSALMLTSCAQEEVDADAVTAFMLELFNEGEIERVEEYVSPDLVIHFLDSRPDQEGVESLTQWVMGVRTVLPDFNIAIDQRVVEGDRIARSEERRVGKECRSRWS